VSELTGVDICAPAKRVTAIKRPYPDHAVAPDDASTRALIVAADATTAETVRRALRYAPTCRVLGWVAVHRLSARHVAEILPNVVVLDHGDDRGGLLAQARAIRDAVPEAKIVLLTEELDAAALAEATATGIDAVIAKSASPATVGMLVREVAAGHVFHIPRTAPAAANGTPAAGGLTSREQEILRHVSAGLSNGRIAAELWVTEQTVKFHLSNIYRKLGVSNRTEAARYAHLSGWSTPTPLAAS
jgi:DNA-binding NarL/FixJ family response regulator